MPSTGTPIPFPGRWLMKKLNQNLEQFQIAWTGSPEQTTSITIIKKFVLASGSEKNFYGFYSLIATIHYIGFMEGYFQIDWSTAATPQDMEEIREAISGEKSSPFA